MVDVRKYAAGGYCRSPPTWKKGTVIKRIINVEETDGKFGPKLDAWFEDGKKSRLSLSGKNVGELMRVYGTRTSEFIVDKNVQLTK